MRRSWFLLIITTIAVCFTMSAFAQELSSPEQGTIIAPPSTRGLPNLKVHTPLYVFKPANTIPDNNPPLAAENPGSLACIYGETTPTPGCPRSGSPVATGGTKAIAVVDYGHNSTLQADFNTFTAQYGLPSQTLIFQCACGSCPSNDGTGWDLETALDVEYAHAMAPNAQLIVSEFCSDPLGDGAETNASHYIATNYGAGEVSNSWGYNGGENWCGSGSCELSYDSNFIQNGVVFFVSAGDAGLGTAYPSVSPNVVSVGGTTITRDGSGNFTGESCWSGSGGGISQYEPLPPYQQPIVSKTGPHRGTPDWAADASPASGAAVYSTTACGGWCKVGGTSLSSPLLAGYTNFAGHFVNRTINELLTTYAYYRTTQYHRYFFDVTTGSNGSPAGIGWDECTGLGTPRVPSGF